MRWWLMIWCASSRDRTPSWSPSRLMINAAPRFVKSKSRSLGSWRLPFHSDRLWAKNHGNWWKLGTCHHLSPIYHQVWSWSLSHVIMNFVCYPKTKYLETGLVMELAVDSDFPASFRWAIFRGVKHSIVKWDPSAKWREIQGIFAGDALDALDALPSSVGRVGRVGSRGFVAQAEAPKQFRRFHPCVRAARRMSQDVQQLGVHRHRHGTSGWSWSWSWSCWSCWILQGILCT